MTFAGVEYWDRFFQQLRESHDDLDWAGRWTDPFLPSLRRAQVRTVLELGCGTGNDAMRLVDAGYAVTAVDISREAIERARSRYGSRVSFHVADMTLPLPFPVGSFDAVMSNVALHMFPDGVTRSVFTQIGQVVRPGGLFLFHVNALEDRPLRARALPVTEEPEKDFVVEQTGQTMHFFSDEYLRDLLHEWSEVQLDQVEIADADTGEPVKRVWRGVACR